MPAKGQAAKKGMKKKGGKKKVVDPFLKKDWYVIKVPKYMKGTEWNKYRVGFTPANKTKAKKALASRTFVINLADLKDKPFEKSHDKSTNIKFNFITEEVFGQQILTQWNGMEITRDHRCSLIRKERTMVQGIVDAKTQDGYTLRIKSLAFTKRLLEQVKKHSYAKRSQVRQIRSRMLSIIRSNVQSTTLEGVIKKLMNKEIGRDIKKSCQLVYPLQACLIEKVKVIKKPKKDAADIMRIHDLTHGFDAVADKDLAGVQTPDSQAGDGEEKKEEGKDGDGDGDVKMGDKN